METTSLFHLSSMVKESDKLVLAIVFFTNMLDNLLLTVVVPIIPDYLLGIDNANWEYGNRTVLTNQSNLIMSSKNQSEETITQRIFLLSANIMNENSKVGWLLSSKAIVQLIANPFISPLAGRFGYQCLLFAGTTIILVSTLVFAFSVYYIPLFIARSVQGLGSAALAIGGMSIVAERYPDDKQRSKAMGVAMGGSATGILVGYPFGGFMYTFVGKVAPFCIIAVFIALDLACQWLILKPYIFHRREKKTTSLLKLLQDPYILVISGSIMLTSMAMAVIEPTVPLWIMQTMNAEKWQIGLVFLPDSIGYLIGTNFFGVTARNIGRWITTIVCMVMISLCLICLPFATELTQLLLPHLGLGLGLGATDAALMPMLALLVDTRHDAFYGSVYAIAQLSVCLAYSVGPSVAGQLVKIVGFPWLIRGLGIISILYTPLCILLRKVPIPSENTMILSGDNQHNDKHELDDADDGSFSYGRLHEED